MTRRSDQRWPVLMCGFRPFFLLGASYAVLAMAAWGGFLLGCWNLPASAGGPIDWHGREMLFGFIGAALAGFLLTAAPEFTNTPPIQGRRLAGLVGLWVLARMGGWAGLPFGTWWAGAADIGLLLGLVWQGGKPLFRDKRHRSLALGLMGILILTGGYYLALLSGGDASKWLRAVVGWYMILIVLAMSRISMRVVNRALEERGEARDYLARPPRRNLAVLCFAIHLAAEFWIGPAAVTGWCAMAAGAAMLNLLSDWHMGRVVFCRRVLMLYLVYWAMALGYLIMGISILSGSSGGWLSGGRHLAMMGGMGLAVLSVFLIAGRAHAGLDTDERRWVWAPLGLLLGAAFARVGYTGLGCPILLHFALAGWIAAFLLYLFYYWRILWRERADGKWGC